MIMDRMFRIIDEEFEINYDRPMPIMQDNRNMVTSLAMRNENTSMANFEPIFSIVFAKGIPRTINGRALEFKEDLVAQRLFICGLNCNPTDYIYELVGIAGTRTQIYPGSPLTLRHVGSVFGLLGITGTKYSVVCHTGTHEIHLLDIIINPRNYDYNPNSHRRDIISLLSVQSSPDISLPRRTFFDFLAQVGLGIHDALNKYKEEGVLPRLGHYSKMSGLPGLNSLFMFGNDTCIKAVVEYIVGTDEFDIRQMRGSNNNGGNNRSPRNITYDNNANAHNTNVDINHNIVLGKELVAELCMINMYDVSLPTDLILAIRELL